MKRYVLTGIVLAVAGSLVVTQAKAEGGPTLVYVNDQEPVMTNEPQIEDGRTLVEYRAVMEALDVEVRWDQETQTIETTSPEGDQIELTIGETEATVNGKTHELDIAPRVENERAIIPLRFISEASGYQVDWGQEVNMIHVNDGTASSHDFALPPLGEETLQDAEAGQVGPFPYDLEEWSVAEVINEYGLPDGRSDGTPDSGDVPYLTYGDYAVTFLGADNGESAQEEWYERDIVSQGEVTEIQALLDGNTVQDVVDAFGEPDYTEEGMYTTLAYDTGDYRLAVRTEADRSTAAAYYYNVLPR
ncbi:stalk domain-containing protein [Salsuginibacillus kocurii]|uniref:stalk domain-containing protein n=1 Tax=Salsuginibacillus kocurii TaxID=427078 RepID=UPI00035D73D0|nr:stalk domain-containing protein [Salsuginibacillus kocurii]